MWMMATILSKEYFTHHGNRNRFYLFLLLTLGATMGVFLSADLYTTFIFFEIMSFTSYVWVAQEEDEASLRAAGTYLAVAVLGGLVMLMGIFLLYHALGTLTISELHDAAAAYENKGLLYAAGACMLVGFGAKAGSFPLHIWLPKAHPVAPAPASALLSGILTKSGVYGMLILSCQLFLHDSTWGALILGLGVVTMFGGALLAVFSIDLKRTLACSSMSQIGFIMVGIGMQGLLGEENALAVHGTLLHMVNHSMIKLVLFLAAGVIFMNAHALDLNKIRGFGRKKPLLKVIFLIGALAIGGIPFFGGYVSKTLLHESIVEFGGGWLMRAVEYIFLFSGGMTVGYMTKLFVAIFVEENNDAKLQKKYDEMKQYMNPESTFALAGSAAILLIWGLFPHGIMDRAAALGQQFMNLEEFGHVVSYFSLGNLKGALISIVIGAVVYLLFIRKVLMQKDARGNRMYVNLWPKWLDLEDMLYRPLLLNILPFIFGVLCRILDTLADLLVVVLRKTIYKDSPLPQELSEGTVFTVAFGKVLNAVRDLGNLTKNRKHPVTRDYVHMLAVKREELRENNMIIGRSLSFGLMLVCVGLCLTLIYILWM
jgi:hydrogenase-4 component B